MKKVIVTGGGGFIGAYLVKKMVKNGWQVSVVDNLMRGSRSRLDEVIDTIELFRVDIRKKEELVPIFRGIDVVFHLAAINGTENFYNHPDLVLDVGVKGMLAVVEAAKEAKVFDLVVASSAEVYQTPSVVPTSEDVPLWLPNSTNPRYSYGGSKILSELVAFNYGREHFKKLQVFRPHNVYGPDMGWKHVIPQFLTRSFVLEASSDKKEKIAFSIQGSGKETRAFCYVDDVVEGILTMYEKGSHREIYHIGNEHEISIKKLVEITGKILGLDLKIEPSDEVIGATPRRCPNIAKMNQLGYTPKIGIEEGMRRTAQWYRNNQRNTMENKLL